jgi:dihydroorotase (multifunctional complex type)
MEDYDLVLRNGEVCTPSGRHQADVGVRAEKIAALANPGEISGRKEIDLRGKIILPGLIHTHVHMREPGLTHKEDYESGTMAAALGGITCTIDMPNVIPATTTVERYLEKKEMASGKAYVDYQHWPGPVSPEEIHRFGKLGGIPGIKAFMVKDPRAKYPHIPELSISNHGDLFELMKAAREVGLPMLVHGADSDLMHAMARPNMNDNSYGARFRSYNYNNWWFASRDIGSWVAIMIARLSGVKVHILHLGNGRTTHQYVRQAKAEGQLLTGEMEGIWLIERQDDPVRRKWLEVGYYRPECDYTDELWSAVNDGTTDVLLMEHAPHHIKELIAGETNIWDAPAGLPSLQEMLPLFLTQVNRGKTTLERFVLLTAEKPAQLAGLYPQKGAIQVGSDADFTVIDLKAKKVISNGEVVSKVEFTPWDGYEVQGIPVMTIVRGQIVMKDGKVVGKKGFGKYISASH